MRKRIVKSISGINYIKVSTASNGQVEKIIPEQERDKRNREHYAYKKANPFWQLALMSIMLCVSFASCTSCCKLDKKSEVEKSWEIYCLKYDVDQENPSEKEYNFYLDCYSGSCEEENDLKYYE